MCNICTENYLLDWRDIKENLKLFIHELNSHLDISKIILFGSFARGDFHENSDVDLIIVGKFQERFFKRIGKVIDLAPKGLIIEPLVYNEEEIENMITDENPFILNALSEGIILFSTV